MTIVQCPHCKKPVPWTEASIYRPFCSERCKIIDLGAWADGTYSIPTSEVLDPNEIEDDESDGNQDSSGRESEHEDE